MNPSVNETGLANPVNRVFDLKINATKMLKVGTVAFFACLKNIKIPFGLFVMLVFGAVLHSDVGALTIQQKVEAFNLHGCYVNGAFVSSPESIKIGEFDSHSKLFSGVLIGNLKMVQNLGTSYSSFSVDCNTLLSTYVLPDRGLPTGKIAQEEEQVKRDFLTKMGYEQKSSGDICYRFPMSVDVADSFAGYVHYNYVSRSLCAASDDTPASQENIYITNTADEDYSSLVPGYSDPVKISITRSGVGVRTIGKILANNFKFSDSSNTTFGGLIASIKRYLIETYGVTPVVTEHGNPDSGITVRTYSFDVAANIGPIPAGDTSAAEWVTGRNVGDSLRALGQLYGITNINELELTSEEKKTLYIDYLKNHYSLDVRSKDDVSAADAATANYEELIDTGSGKSCWARALVDDEVNASSVNVNVEGGYINISKGWRALVAELGLDIVCEGEDFAQDLNSGEIGGEDRVTGSCVSSGAAKSLGWVLCPALDLMTDAVKSMYDDYVAEALMIEPKLFVNNQRGENYTLDAWTFFRGVANVVFIVLLLLVIFSQLSGVGMDNYGIKKILPKLIVMAVLVNLSYYICVICVDLSNIIGSGIQSLFDNISIALPQYINTAGGEVPLDGVGAGLTAAGVLVAVVGVGAVIWNPAILVSLLVSAIGVLISVLFLFVLLSVREAAIVVLTVVSPVAFACYILPNAKKVFDVWLKAGQGLLLVFPICGLMVGGGGYVSRLLLAVNSDGGGFFIVFAAMVIGVAPIFFIPTLLKNSFAALGNIGAKISGIGERVRKGTERRIRETGMYKGAQERGLERKTRIMAGVDTRGESKNLTGVGRFLRGGRRNIARSRVQYLKNQDAQTREDSLMGVGFEATSIAQEKKAGADEIANYMMLINNRTDNGANEEALLGIFDEYAARGNKYGMVAAARIAGRRKDTAARFMASTIMSGEDSRGNAYDQGLMRDVAKEMSEGERAGNYRAGTPVGFEYAAKVNQGAVTNTFQVWSAEKNNISEAMQHHVTNSSELVGVQNSSLRFIADKMEQGGMSEEEIARVRNLARETIRNRGTTGIWDTTKEENIYRIAYGDSNFAARIAEDRVATNQGATTQNASPQGVMGQSSAVQNNGAQPAVSQSVARAMNVGQANGGVLTTRPGGTTNNTQTPGPVRVQVRQVRPGERGQRDK